MASPLVNITSQAQFAEVLRTTRLVVIDFYADWCGPCKMIAPVYEQLANKLSKPNALAFLKVNTDEQSAIAREYGVTAMPTFVVIRDGKVIDKAQGANPGRLQAMVRNLVEQISGQPGEGSSPETDLWLGEALPRGGYHELSHTIEKSQCELLNSDDAATVLFDTSKPSALSKGKSPASSKDWIESSADHQVLLFVPFRQVLKVHTLQITSLPPSDDEDAPMRPRLLHIYTNRPHNLDFAEADSMPPTQVIDISEEDWNEEGTVSLPLRFVKFQNVSSLVIYVVEGNGDGDVMRLDRVRFLGESGEKLEMGKLPKDDE